MKLWTCSVKSYGLLSSLALLLLTPSGCWEPSSFQTTRQRVVIWTFLHPSQSSSTCSGSPTKGLWKPFLSFSLPLQLCPCSAWCSAYTTTMSISRSGNFTLKSVFHLRSCRALRKAMSTMPNCSNEIACHREWTLQTCFPIVIGAFLKKSFIKEDAVLNRRSFFTSIVQMNAQMWQLFIGWHWTALAGTVSEWPTACACIRISCKPYWTCSPLFGFLVEAQSIADVATACSPYPSAFCVWILSVVAISCREIEADLSWRRAYAVLA